MNEKKGARGGNMVSPAGASRRGATAREDDLGGVRRREFAEAGAERQRDLGAIRLVADRDHGRGPAGDGGEHVLRRRAGRTPIVHPQLRPRGLRDRCGCLARAQKRAREHELGLRRRQPLAERPSLLPATFGQRPQLVGLTGGRMGVPDEEEAHGC